MKCIHLSDLHIGKRVNEFSMVEDQVYIFNQILHIIDLEKPDAVLISGDIYDKTVPSAEAVSLCDDFLFRLSKCNVQTYVISGNHDSAERIAFGRRLMGESGVHMSPVYSKGIKPIEMEDEHGTIAIYLLPFIKPTHVRAQFPDETIETYTDAMKVAIEDMDVDQTKRNILLAHQFVTGSERSESEEISVGGSDNVAAYVFDPFDYVALGHIHKPQSVGRETIRYCGTPLKYSFSEANHQKSVTVVELHEKGNINIRTVDLTPKRDMREIKGTYMEVTAKNYYDSLNLDDYYHITLTDEEDIFDALSSLRTIYKNIMKLDYDNKRTATQAVIHANSEVESKSPLQLFNDLYEKQNNQSLSQEQIEFLVPFIEKTWEEQR